MRRYNLTNEAKADLADIKAYLTKESGASTARYVLKRIKKERDFLSRTPGAGHLREDLTDTTVKFWPVFSYLIIYKTTICPIGIVRVVHGSREITPSMLSQDD